MTFGLWLLTQGDRKDLVGTTAQYAAWDATFPRDEMKLYIFLAWAGANEPLRELVKGAHREWRRSSGETLV